MTDLPAEPSMVPQAMGGDPATGDEIFVAFGGPAAQNRLTVLVRVILAIPHFIVLWILGIAVQVVVVISWFAALFTGQVPRGMADFIAGYLRWATRVYAYLFLLTDEYPPFEMGDSDYPVHLAVRPGRLNRLAVLFRIILAIPAWLICILLIYGMGTIAIFVTWLIVLFAGRMPETLYEAIAAVLRYVTRFYGYVFLLTGTYPKGLFGDRPDQPGYGPQAGYGQQAADQPGYGQQAADQPGYGQPGSGGPGYGQPGSGQSAYVQAGPAGPAYAQPAYAQSGSVPGGSEVAPRWPVDDQQAWRLVLSGGAKALIWVFLALGALVLVAYIATITIVASSSKTVNGANAAIKSELAYAKLSTAMSSYSTKVAACHGDLTCVKSLDGQAAQAFGVFAQALRAIPVPSGSASAAKGQLQLEATAVQNDFQQLSTSSSVSQYQQTLSSVGLEKSLNQFDADYQKLGTALIGNS